MEACEADDESLKSTKCKWSDCSAVGYCQWDGILGRSTKEKRACTQYANEVDCNQGNGGRSGCEWKRGPAPDNLYQLADEDSLEEVEYVYEDEDDYEKWFIFSRKDLDGMSATANAISMDMNWMIMFVSFLSLFLIMICVYGTRKWTTTNYNKEEENENENTPMIRI